MFVHIIAITASGVAAPGTPMANGTNTPRSLCMKGELRTNNGYVRVGQYFLSLLPLHSPAPQLLLAAAASLNCHPLRLIPRRLS